MTQEKHKQHDKRRQPHLVRFDAGVATFAGAAKDVHLVASKVQKANVSVAPMIRLNL